MPEVFEVADRVYVVSDGRLSEPLDVSGHADVEALASAASALERHARRARTPPPDTRPERSAVVKQPVEHLAHGLGHPEGPDVLPDGRIVFVETYTSRIVAWSPERGVHLYADCGGGPNACVLGSDGCVYITQNGGTVGPGGRT